MSEPVKHSPAALAEILQKPGFLSGSRRWLAFGGLFLLLLLFGVLLVAGNKAPGGQFITEEAATGQLVVTVSASGTLQPTKSVDVGSEQSGTLVSVLVQENDRVRKGQLLAQLDTAKLQEAVVKSRAALAAAEAAVAQAQATVAEGKASLARMRRVAEISGGKVPAQTEMETAEAALQRAVANEASARAAVVQAQATLKTDETNLAKGTVRSPVDGVVLARKVEPGQTVVSAMTIPVLFTLAEDLATMELQVNVDEADVASVQVGQPATFTVSAWPGRHFPATIERVGLGATTIDNVVTYKTVLAVRNDDLALRPGMTATATIVTARRDNVLLVPNAALRFTPPQTAPKKQESFVSRLLPRPPVQRPQQNGQKSSGGPQVWVLESGAPRAMPVEVGAGNGGQTEIVGGALRAGMAVITDYQEGKR